MKRYSVALNRTVVQRLKPHFLSLTLDTSLLIGGRWWGQSKGTSEGLSRDRVEPLDLENPALARWAGLLAPALIRMGGTEADRIHYGFHRDGPGHPTPQEAGFVLKGKFWRRFNEWAAAQGLQVLFTVSAGPESRTPDGSWDSAGAERLLRNTRRRGHPVVAWEFGNEVNAYPFLYGLKRSVSRSQYLEDFGRFAELVRRLAPGSKTVGPSSAIWPLIGEPNPLIPALGKSPVSAFLDVLSFHYYPQQSSRGRVAVRRAKEATLLNSRALNGALRWIRHCRKALSRGAGAAAPLWITETGHALYGGEPGISDTWLSTPWWLDQLGLMAHAGVEAVFRQSLVGGDYGLLAQDTFLPRPDYFASLLWKTKMGPVVYAQPGVRGRDRKLRAWHHGFDDGSSCVLLVNLHRRGEVCVDFEEAVTGAHRFGPAGGADSAWARLDGRLLQGESGVDAVLNGKIPPLPPEGLVLAPLECAFVHLPGRTPPYAPMR